MLKHAGQYALQLLEALEPEVCGDSSGPVVITDPAAVSRLAAPAGLLLVSIQSYFMPEFCPTVGTFVGMLLQNR